MRGVEVYRVSYIACDLSLSFVLQRKVLLAALSCRRVLMCVRVRTELYQKSTCVSMS